MELFDRFYLRLGFNRVDHFYNPLVIKMDTFVFPLHSEAYNFKVTEAIEGISKKGLYTRTDKIIVETILKYRGELEGRYKLPPANNNLLIAELAKKYPDIKYLRDTGQTSVNITKSTLYVHNYACLTNRYDYIKNEYVNKWKFHNALSTVIEDLNNINDKNHFLILELPDRLPDFQKLNFLCRNMTLAKIRAIKSYKYFTLLELWKFFTPELKEESLFNKIKEENRVKVNILFTTFSGVHITNLGVLESIVKEYNDKVSSESLTIVPETIGDFNNLLNVEFKDNLKYSSNFVSTEDARMRGKVIFKAKTFLKLFYIYINNIINAGTENEVKPGLTSGALISADDDLEKYEKEDKVPKITDQSKLDEYLDKQIKLATPSEGVIDVEDEVKTNIEDVDQDDIDTNIASAVLEENMEDNSITFNNVEEIYQEDEEPIQKKLNDNLEVLRDNGIISKIVMKNMKDKIDKDVVIQRYTKDGKVEKLDVKNILNSKNKINIDKVEIGDNKTVLDKTYNSNIVNALDEQYIKNNYMQDVIKTIYSLEKSLVVIDKYEIQPSQTTDDLETHVVSIKPLNGQPSTLRFVIPKPKEDGTFNISENTYRMRKQRQQVPIYKVSPTQVALNSYYGKIFINKAIKKTYTYGYWLCKKLLTMDNVSNVTPGELDVPDVNLFKLYGDIARGVMFFDLKLENDKKQIRVLRFSFDYETRHNFTKLTEEELSKIENDNSIIVGESLTFVNKDEPISEIMVMNNKGDISLVDSKMVVREFDNFFNLLNINQLDGPIEYATVKVLKEHIPAGILLSFYIGLESLIKALKVDYRVFDKGHRKEIEELMQNGYYRIRFMNKTLCLKRDNGLGDMILGGLVPVKELSEVNLENLNNRASFLTVFNILDYPVAYVKEIKIMEDMFIDPMTKDVLEELKLPLTFRGLIIKACEMLLNDTHKRHNNIEGQMIKGYERVSGMIYKTIVNGIRQHENRTAFSRSKIVVDPYEVITKVKEDNVTVQLDDINPISIIKLAGEVSYLGDGGRSIETMTKETRIRSKSEIGIFSESVKDNGDVAVLSNLVPNVNIDNIRGIVTKEGDISKGWGNIVSPTALLAPFSTFDDGKRINFISIMAGHVVPINEMKVPRIRTGYESIVPVISNDKYSVSAKEAGVVKSIDKKHITIEYKDKRKESYKFIKWTTKEESGACYTHELVTSLKVGDKVEKDDTILYDKTFFEPDIFNKKRVLYKQGTYINTAIVENTETYEDSGSISSKICKRLGTTITKVHSIVINCTDIITNVIDIGEKVEFNTPMFSFVSKEAGDVSGLDKKTLEILKEMNTSSPKAKANGVIDNYVIRYNCEKNEMSKSLLKLVEESDERLKFNKGNPGRVSSNYSVKGKPLMPGEVEIKVYIKVNENMGIGDKGIFGNQLKFTVGDIYDNEIVTEETNTPVEGMFGFISIQARIVNSPILIGTTAKVMELIEDKMIEEYFGK